MEVLKVLYKVFGRLRGEQGLKLHANGFFPMLHGQPINLVTVGEIIFGTVCID